MAEKRQRGDDAAPASGSDEEGGGGARLQAGGFGRVTAAEKARRVAELKRQDDFVRGEIVSTERLRMAYLAGQSDFFKCVRGAGWVVVGRA